MTVSPFTLSDRLIGKPRRHTPWTCVVEANPVDGVGVFDLLPIDVSVVPKVEASSPISNQIVAAI